jgi:hypothetical protein
MLIVVALAGLTGAMVAFASVTINTRSVTTINGDVFTITGDLTVSGFSTSIAWQGINAVGTSGSPVAMTSGGSVANTAITMGDYTYSVTVTIANSQVSQEYAVTLKQDGASQGIVYIAQDAAGTVGYKVIVTWDLGLSLASHVYEIDIVTSS